MTTKGERTVLEAKSARSALESLILSAVRGFEDETGMTVEAISINRLQVRHLDGSPRESAVYEVVADVRL